MARPDRLTPEEARALVERHGSQRAAARAAGVAYSTLRWWLNPERAVARRREYRASHPESREREREAKRERYANDPEHREREKERYRERYANDPEFRERAREYKREWYDNLSGYEHNGRLLRDRRRQALARIAARNEGRPEESPAKRQGRADAQHRAEQLQAEEIQRRQEAASG